MWVDLAHFIWDMFKGCNRGDNNKEIDEEVLVEIMQEIEEARQKTDFWIKINTALLGIGLLCQISILVLLIIK